MESQKLRPSAETVSDQRIKGDKHKAADIGK